MLTHHDIGQNRENRDQHIEEGQCANVPDIVWLEREEIEREDAQNDEDEECLPRHLFPEVVIRGVEARTLLHIGVEHEFQLRCDDFTHIYHALPRNNHSAGSDHGVERILSSRICLGFVEREVGREIVVSIAKCQHIMEVTRGVGSHDGFIGSARGVDSTGGLRDGILPFHDMHILIAMTHQIGHLRG